MFYDSKMIIICTFTTKNTYGLSKADHEKVLKNSTGSIELDVLFLVLDPKETYYSVTILLNGWY